MDKLLEKVANAYKTPSDINEHMLHIVNYATMCEHITEMGVRGIVSTWGWLGGKPKKLVCYDLHDPSTWGGNIQEVYDVAKEYGIDFKFNQADVLKVEIEETDLLFIDTWHAYDQLKQELSLHANKVRHFICFHDTTTYEFKNESTFNKNSWTGDLKDLGIWPAIEEFLYENREWTLYERLRNNNGFCVIKKRQ